jgi:2-polyprenyl-3-methyl-5-hydroxy-6-metoxy-1,4-benzoquinol methylase
VSDAIATDATARTTDASWDWHWRRQRLPRLPRWFNPNVAFTKKVLWRALESSPKRPFEVGCAPGAWMGFLSRLLNVEVSGCDLSALGVATTRRNLRLLNVPGRVYEANVFDLAEKIPERFGLVYSFGVVEHFDDLTGILHAHADLCETNGTVAVTAPNLQGLSGAIFRRASPNVMSSHRLVTPADLRRAAQQAGLEPVAAGYGGPLSTFVWLDRIDSRIRRVVTYAFSMVVGLLSFPSSSRLLAGSVYLIAKRS